MNILFICTGNLNRSAAAHVILNSHGSDKYEVKSCGTGKVAPLKKEIPRKMRTALEGLGYDPDNHRSQGISEELLYWADIVVVMGNVHRRFIADNFPQHEGKVENWNIKDPHFEPGCEVHRQVAKQIECLVKKQFG